MEDNNLFEDAFLGNEPREVLNEDKVGNLFGSNKIVVIVRTSEGENIPHMHIEGLSEDEDICVEIFRPVYFDHNDYHKGKFNSRELKEFVKFMGTLSKNSKYQGLTNWEVTKRLWLRNHGPLPDFIIDNGMPDYSKMK